MCDSRGIAWTRAGSRFKPGYFLFVSLLFTECVVMLLSAERQMSRQSAPLFGLLFAAWGHVPCVSGSFHRLLCHTVTWRCRTLGRRGHTCLVLFLPRSCLSPVLLGLECVMHLIVVTQVVNHSQHQEKRWFTSLGLARVLLPAHPPVSKLTLAGSLLLYRCV